MRQIFVTNLETRRKVNITLSDAVIKQLQAEPCSFDGIVIRNHEHLYAHFSLMTNRVGYHIVTDNGTDLLRLGQLVTRELELADIFGTMDTNSNVFMLG